MQDAQPFGVWVRGCWQNETAVTGIREKRESFQPKPPASQYFRGKEQLYLKWAESRHLV